MKPQPDDQVRLKQQARDFFEEQSLGTASLETLLDKSQQRPTPRQQFFRQPVFHVAVSLAVALLIMLWLPAGDNLPQKIAREVAKNHIHMKPLEIRTQDLDELRNYFTELDFSVAQSVRFMDRTQTMLGARYCSIQGVSAAQLRYSNPTGNPTTLYQVGYDPDTFGQLPAIENNQSPIQITTLGVNVKLWTEKGLLIAEVEDSN